MQLARIVGWALLKWSADIASLALVFVALGATPRISALLVGFGVTQLATAIPVTPGGVGFVEGGMVGAFVTLVYGAATAASVVVVYRVLATWLPVLAGVPLLLRQPRTGADPLARAAPPERVSRRTGVVPGSAPTVAAVGFRFVGRSGCGVAAGPPGRAWSGGDDLPQGSRR